MVCVFLLQFLLPVEVMLVSEHSERSFFSIKNVSNTTGLSGVDSNLSYLHTKLEQEDGKFNVFPGNLVRPDSKKERGGLGRGGFQLLFNCLISSFH